MHNPEVGARKTGQQELKEFSLLRAHERLGIEQDASEQEIKAARNRLVKKYHPDLVPARLREYATEKLKYINTAVDEMLARIAPQERRQATPQSGPDSGRTGNTESPREEPHSAQFIEILAQVRSTLPRWNTLGLADILQKYLRDFEKTAKADGLTQKRVNPEKISGFGFETSYTEQEYLREEIRLRIQQAFKERVREFSIPQTAATLKETYTNMPSMPMDFLMLMNMVFVAEVQDKIRSAISPYRNKQPLHNFIEVFEQLDTMQKDFPEISQASLLFLQRFADNADFASNTKRAIYAHLEENDLHKLESILPRLNAMSGVRSSLKELLNAIHERKKMLKAAKAWQKLQTDMDTFDAEEEAELAANEAKIGKNRQEAQAALDEARKRSPELSQGIRKQRAEEIKQTATEFSKPPIANFFRRLFGL